MMLPPANQGSVDTSMAIATGPPPSFRGTRNLRRRGHRRKTPREFGMTGTRGVNRDPPNTGPTRIDAVPREGVDDRLLVRQISPFTPSVFAPRGPVRGRLPVTFAPISAPPEATYLVWGCTPLQCG
jgi:hypothetical protein